jgi:hypothetical protein
LACEQRNVRPQHKEKHTNADALCAVCGCVFPCESAVLAEHNTALL